MKRHARGFTVVELMIAVCIVALVASFAVPAYRLARLSAFRGKLVAELRATKEAFQMYVAENDVLPESSSGFGAVPAGMESYLPKNSTWQSSPAFGGFWTWLNVPGGLWGFDGFIGLYTDAPVEELHKIDELMDDGNARGGAFRVTSSGGGHWGFYGLK